MLLIAILIIAAVYAIVTVSVYALQKKRHQKMYDRVMSSMEETETDVTSRVVSSKDNTEKQMEQLKSHLNSGLITKEEYKARKQNLLKN